MDHRDIVKHIERNMSPARCRHEWHDWCDRNLDDEHVPLFDMETVEKDRTYYVAKTDTYGAEDRTVLKRHPHMEAILRLEVRFGLMRQAFLADEDPYEFFQRRLNEYENVDWEMLKQLRDVFIDGAPDNGSLTLESERGYEKVLRFNGGEAVEVEGIIYLMYALDRNMRRIPLYIGICSLHNSGKYVNQTFTHTSDAKFARWGYGQYQHLGELSAALFEDAAFDPAPKYDTWVDRLFLSGTRVLKRPVFFAAEAWEPAHGSIEDVETFMIKIASKAYPDELLNVRGRVRDDTLASFS